MMTSGEIQSEGGRKPRGDTEHLLHRVRSSSEIVEERNDGDVEARNAVFCRICLECDGEDDELISPCLCKGTQQFVHRSCLDHWRSVKEGFAFAHCTTCNAQFHLRPAETEGSSQRKLKFRLFVARDVVLVFLAIQFVVGSIACSAYTLHKRGIFNNSFKLTSRDPIVSGHPFTFYYSIGVVGFFVLVGFIGTMIHCCNNTNDPRVAACQNCFCGCGMLDCFPASWEAWFVIGLVSIVILSILGIAYGFFAGTVALQRIWQRHFHILTKKELTKEYIVEDLGGAYSPPKLDLEHEIRLRMLKLL